MSHLTKADELRQRIESSKQYQRMVEEQLAAARHNLEHHEKHVAEAREAVETYEHQVGMLKFEQADWSEEIRRELKADWSRETADLIVALLSDIMREQGVSTDEIADALKLIGKGDD
jgi:predicted  nucleic acid-binding Zn-ribbon protein